MSGEYFASSRQIEPTGEPRRPEPTGEPRRAEPSGEMGDPSGLSSPGGMNVDLAVCNVYRECLCDPRCDPELAECPECWVMYQGPEYVEGYAPLTLKPCDSCGYSTLYNGKEVYSVNYNRYWDCWYVKCTAEYP